ncbi:MAG: hypothetical protein GX099_08780 [Clostridiaceae bacterium]|nr:hypothetical protein [Oscillospiraceae bacterium]NLO63502.1 hypothetical protein [Clostridiaceae bacterium]
MNAGKRALFVSVLLFLLWGTVVGAPFRYFVDAVHGVVRALSDLLRTPAPVSTLITVALLLAITMVYLLLRSGKAAEYTAIIAAVCAVIYHLYLSVTSRSIVGMSVPVLLGLIAAILFMLFQADRATLCLSDAYFYAIPVYLFYELVMSPVFTAAGIPGKLLSPFITVSPYGLASGFGNLFGVPMWLWGAVIFFVAILPVIYFSRGKGPARRELDEFRL